MPAKSSRDPAPLDLGKRERQIVEAVYRLGEASVAEVRRELREPPTYSTVRAMLGQLVDKKVLKFRQLGKRYLYRPAVAREAASKSALRSLIATFFGGQPTDVMAALLDVSSENLTDDDLARMRKMIQQAAQEQSR